MFRNRGESSRGTTLIYYFSAPSNDDTLLVLLRALPGGFYFLKGFLPSACLVLAKLSPAAKQTNAFNV